MSYTEYIEKQNKAVKQAKELHEKAKSENRDLSDSELDQFNQLIEQAEKYASSAGKLKRLEDLEVKVESRGRVSTPGEIDLPRETKERYSLLRAINKAASGKLDGLEKEVSDEIAKQTGKSPTGFYMPFDFSNVEKYALDSTTGTGAIATVKDTSNFIEALRNKMVIQEAGARVLGDLRGDLSVPKQTGSGTAYWIAEGVDTTASNQTIGQVALSPSTVAAYTDLTRKFVLQSSVDAEMFVRDDLATVLAIELDRVAINGSGTGAEPEGILQNSSVPSVSLGTDGGDPTWAAIVSLETEVSQDNADVGNLAYLTNAKARGKLKNTVKVSGQPVYLWENGEFPVNGYRCMVSNQVPSNLSKGVGTNLSGMIFGDFSSILIGMWGGVDVIVDPYSLSKSGGLRVAVMLDCDVQLRHTEAYSKIVDMTTV